MGDELNVGGTDANQGGTEVANQSTETTQKLIKQEDHDLALKDLHKFKSKLKDTSAELENLKSELTKERESKLAEQNNFKTLYEQYKTKAEASEKEKKDLMSSFYIEKKRSSLEAEALKAGIRKEALEDLDLLDLEPIAVERTDRGRAMVHGASEYVESLKKTKPHWFSNGTNSMINSGGLSQTVDKPSELTPAYMVSLEKKDPKKFKELMPKYIEQRNKKRS